MEDKIRRSMIDAAMAAPYLERQEESDLARQWKEHRDQDAMHQITLAHMRLVVAMAGRFRHFGLSMNDLIQEGYVGLHEAAARIEPERHVRFSPQKALFFNLRRLRARLARVGEPLGYSAVYKEISSQVGVTEEDVALMDSRLSGPDTSLNAPLMDGESGSAGRQDFLVSDDPLPDEVAADEIDRQRRAGWLHGALNVLNERERQIIAERRLRDDGTTLEALGARLGISKERVRQIESRAIDKLRTALVRESSAFQG